MDKKKKLRQLQGQKKALVEQAGELLSKDNVTDEDLAAAKAKQAEAEKLNAQIDALNQQIEMELGMEATQEIQADDATAAGNAQAKKPAPKLFANFGEQLQAVIAASKPGGHVDPRLNEINAAASGGGSNVSSDGGYLIQTDFASEIYKLTYETGVLASRVRHVPISDAANALEMPYIDETSRATGSRWGGVQVYRAAEADTVTAKKPKIGKKRIELEKIIGLAYMTEELMRDASAMTAIYNQAFVDEFAFKLDDEIYNGTGAGQCLGLLNSTALVSVSKETGQDAATIVFENVVKMWARLHPRSRTNAAWFINQDIETQLYTMTMSIGTGGIPVYLPPGGLSTSPYATLMGRPVIPIEHAATLGTVGDIMLADLSQYLLIEKDGMRTDTSMHVRFLNDEQTFRFVMRVNGMPIWQSAITPYKGSNTLSPYVALATRS